MPHISESDPYDGVDRSHLVGKRIRLIGTSDPYTTIEPGTEGVVDHVDDVGTLHVSWDDGHTLGMIPGVDAYAVLS